MAGPHVEGTQKLKDSEFLFQQEDGIMEPNIFEVLKKFIAAGGNCGYAVSDLSEKYQGYGPMSSLVVGWTRDLMAQAPPEVVRQPVHDEAYFLAELVKENFTTEKVANVFSSGRPRWLINLIASREGRQLVYDLSAKHHCALLSYAIQQIMKHGHESEVASVGAPLAAYFMVFHTILVTRLRTLKDDSAAGLAQTALKLKEMCCQSQHSYAYVQLILTNLARHGQGSRFKRLSQELESCVAEAQGQVAWQMTRCFTPPGASAADHRALEATITCMCAEDAAALAQPVETLAGMYSADEPPALSLLQHPQVLLRLSDDLMANTLGAEHQQRVISLLALASTGIDDRPAGGQLDRTDSADTAEALHTATGLGEVATLGQRLSQGQLAAASTVAASPAAACAVLRLLRRLAGQASYWRDTAHAFAAPTCLALLVPIVQSQPSLHHQALEVVAAALPVLGSSKPDTVRCFLQVAVMLMQGPECMAVMRQMERSLTSMDPSLVRSFIFQALTVAAPPYSPAFAAIMVRLMAGSSVKRNRGAGRNDAQIRHLEEFAQAVAGLNFQPPLIDRERAFLQDLCTKA
ncbi:hypothetical protein WJX73_001348 [Symbiochloris irregularis]|uniref:Uncharacterized protein n=1 Tax=Symbiochloris irregularis TaxID=706552 RepID=A0AAW1NTG6_9CHLO